MVGGEAQTLSDPPSCLQVLQAQPTPAAAAGSTPTFITIMHAADACVALKKVKLCGNHAHALHLELLVVVVTRELALPLVSDANSSPQVSASRPPSKETLC